MNTLRDIFNAETIKVLAASAVPAGLTLAQASSLVTIAAGVVSIAYTLKKWREKRKDKEP